MRTTICTFMLVAACLIGCGKDAKPTAEAVKPTAEPVKPKADSEPAKLADADIQPAIIDTETASVEPAAEATPVSKVSEFVFNNPIFESPEMIMGAGKPLASDILYPSPAIFDIDNDGKNEMIVGSIFGAIAAAENEADENGEPVWAACQPVNSTKGEPLKLNNW